MNASKKINQQTGNSILVYPITHNSHGIICCKAFPGEHPLLHFVSFLASFPFPGTSSPKSVRDICTGISIRIVAALQSHPTLQQRNFQCRSIRAAAISSTVSCGQKRNLFVSLLRACVTLIRHRQLIYKSRQENGLPRCKGKSCKTSKRVSNRIIDCVLLSSKINLNSTCQTQSNAKFTVHLTSFDFYYVNENCFFKTLFKRK